MGSSGEGSRGGQVIGHTRGGKPIYASHLNSTGRMAHAGAIAGAAPAGQRPAVFSVTHGSDGKPMAPGKYSSARETFEVGPSGRKIGRTMNPTATLPKLPPLREGARSSAYAKHMDAIMSGTHPNAVGTRARGSDATRPAVLNKPGYRPR